MHDVGNRHGQLYIFENLYSVKLILFQNLNCKKQGNCTNTSRSFFSHNHLQIAVVFCFFVSLKSCFNTHLLHVENTNQILHGQLHACEVDQLGEKKKDFFFFFFFHFFSGCSWKLWKCKEISSDADMASSILRITC